MKLYIYLALAAAIVVGLSTAFAMTYSAGKQSVLQRLQQDRITILQDGKRIDEKVLAADDDGLLCMLIECVPDR